VFLWPLHALSRDTQPRRFTCQDGRLAPRGRCCIAMSAVRAPFLLRHRLGHETMTEPSAPLQGGAFRRPLARSAASTATGRRCRGLCAGRRGQASSPVDATALPFESVVAPWAACCIDGLSSEVSCFHVRERRSGEPWRFSSQVRLPTPLGVAPAKLHRGCQLPVSPHRVSAVWNLELIARCATGRTMECARRRHFIPISTVSRGSGASAASVSGPEPEDSAGSGVDTNASIVATCVLPEHAGISSSPPGSLAAAVASCVGDDSTLRTRLGAHGILGDAARFS
jgi:hypothetical protein